MKSIRVKNHKIGPGLPTFVVAEIGLNFNGSLELAYKTIEAAKKVGAQAVKFQNYVTEDFIYDRSITHQYESQGKLIIESQYDLFKRCELDFDKLEKIAAFCDRIDVVFFSTPTSVQGIHELKRLNCPLLKNGSDYIGNLDLIREMAKTQIPLVISTGMASLGEIDDAISTFEGAGGQSLIVLQCTSSYPTPPRDVHLRKIVSLEKVFQYPVGLSDHSKGISAALGAVALGACMIEKHFTLDKTLPGPDHSFSADPTELRSMIDNIRLLEEQLGSYKICPTQYEKDHLSTSKLSCAIASDAVQGYVLREEDIIYQRPGIGVPPKQKKYLVGKRLTKSLKKGDLIIFDEMI